MKYPFFKQLDSKDCGPACLRMVACYFGKYIDAVSARKLGGQYRNGTTMYTISEGARTIGLKTIGLRMTREQFLADNCLPRIVQWHKSHFVVVWGVEDGHVILGDPAVGVLHYSHNAFFDGWLTHTNSNGELCGAALLIDRDKDFTTENLQAGNSSYTVRRLLNFLVPHRWLIMQLLFALLLGSAISLVFPFLTQSVVDIGIGERNITFIICVLGGQLALTIGRAANQYIASWLTLHISSRVSITMVMHFLEKMMKMKISFFNSKMIGDLIQRIQDFSRIETFLTSYLISILMAVLGVIVYGAVLAKYGWTVFIVYMLSMILYLAWVRAFKQRRMKLDYMRFQQGSHNQSMVIHYIQGIQDIKLNGCEQQKLDRWKDVQMNIYDVRVKGLSMLQMQEAGAMFIDNLKKIIITFLCAHGVVEGNLTVGMMMAVTYVVGQLDGPFYQMSAFITAMHEAQISLERINEIEAGDDEEIENSGKNAKIPQEGDISLSDICFSYPGPDRKLVLDHVGFQIKRGCVTAIVGESGSGKSTLLKLLTGFYRPTKGNIAVGNLSFDDMDKIAWRRHCAVVLQDSYLFTETVAENIAGGKDVSQLDKIMKAAEQAGIHNFIMSLPMNYETIIGEDGLALSGGQRQRLFLARAIYRNTPFIFLDEATNALDACNEQSILSNLIRFYKGRTVVVVAHRLSTVVDADHIVVLKEGRVVEQGTHCELFERGGYYSLLVSKQLQDNHYGSTFQ